MARPRRVAFAAVPIVLALAACQEPPAEPPARPADAAPPPGSAGMPLIEIMAGLAADMGRLSMAVWAEDYDSMAAAAVSVADHPKVGPVQRAAIANALGEDFPGFVGFDKRVHDAAVALSEGALDRDVDAVLANLERVQRDCVACHTVFRDRVRAALYEDASARPAGR